VLPSLLPFLILHDLGDPVPGLPREGTLCQRLTPGPGWRGREFTAVPLVDEGERNGERTTGRTRNNNAR
jgi:hypothetical protein